MKPELKLIHKECLSHMKTMPDNSVGGGHMASGRVSDKLACKGLANY
jgi:hypothetical protein